MCQIKVIAFKIKLSYYLLAVHKESNLSFYSKQIERIPKISHQRNLQECETCVQILVDKDAWKFATYVKIIYLIIIVTVIVASLLCAGCSLKCLMCFNQVAPL